MSVTVEITEGPLKRGSSDRAVPTNGAAGSAGSTGASVIFEGIVRAQEENGTIVALDYEAYRPMADRELERLASDILRAHGLHRIAVEHSVGHVRVGEVSFRLLIESAHRTEAMRAMAEFIDRMKLDIPIWKRAVH